MELWTAFALGLAGSLHCAVMCGPLVLALSKARPPSLRESAGRICYHAGRIATYSLLGLIFGFLGYFVAPAGFQRWLSISLGVFLFAGLLVGTRVSLAPSIWSWVTLLQSSMRSLLQRRSLLSQALMGGLNGLLPCGLVYVAVAGATATGQSLKGAAFMACFGLGTWPLMLGIHLAGQRLPLPMRFSIGNVTRGAVVLMASLLILRGLELGIPYLSPVLSSVEGCNHCH